MPGRTLTGGSRTGTGAGAAAGAASIAASIAVSGLAVVAAAGCANPNARMLRDNREFECRERAAGYTVVGSLAGPEIGVQLDCAVAGPRIVRWTVDRDGVRDERQASLGVREFDRIWERIDGSGWRNLKDCTGTGGDRDPAYAIEVKDWNRQNAFTCVNAGPLPFPYFTIVQELDLRAAAIGGPEARGGDE
jgi:hypothetical protein